MGEHCGWATVSSSQQLPAWRRNLVPILLDIVSQIIFAASFPKTNLSIFGDSSRSAINC